VNEFKVYECIAPIETVEKQNQAGSRCIHSEHQSSHDVDINRSGCQYASFMLQNQSECKDCSSNLPFLEEPFLVASFLVEEEAEVAFMQKKGWTS
jgi:hypothetical protein